MQMKQLEKKIALATAKAESERVHEHNWLEKRTRSSRRRKTYKMLLTSQPRPYHSLHPPGHVHDHTDQANDSQETMAFTSNSKPASKILDSGNYRLSVEDQDDSNKIEAALLKSASLSPHMNVKRWWELQRDGTRSQG